ncbi:MAG: hypothetical protein Q4G16_09955, partial [Cruoricaptor ignavus]|nr:hypothetical protein [Cruoricaptor ignavus]
SNETEADSQQNKEKDSLVGSAKPDAEAEQMMNKILPKRGRIKKQTRERYTQNETKKIEQETKKTSEYQEGFVIINGQKIENEKEAIDVTRYSLQLLSEKVTQTVAKTEPITDFVEF